MYLFILEDCKLFKSQSLTEEDLKMANIGLMQIVNMEEGTEYYQGQWFKIPENKH